MSLAEGQHSGAATAPTLCSGGGHKHSRLAIQSSRAARSFVWTKSPVGKSFPRGQIDGFDWIGFFQNSIVKSSTCLETISTSNQKWTHSCKYGGGDGPRVPLVSPIAVIELPGYSELKVWFVELITLSNVRFYALHLDSKRNFNCRSEAVSWRNIRFWSRCTFLRLLICYLQFRQGNRARPKGHHKHSIRAL